MPVLPLVGSTIVPPGLSSPWRFGLIDHIEANPVFNTPPRVEVFNLGENSGATLWGKAIQSDQWSLSNALRDLRQKGLGHRPPPM